MSAKQTKKLLYRKRRSGLRRFGLFLVVFAAIGGGVMILKSSAATTYVAYPPHRAACTQNSPSKTFVKPGEKFTAVVSMQNTGTSNFSAYYGFILSEFNNDTSTNYWNASGGTLSGDVTAGGTATFNLTATAPSQPATYPFNWAMAIVYNGILHDPCSGGLARTVTVKNPPVASLNLNGQPSNISVTQGAGLTLSWSASNGATLCVGFGNWSGYKTPPSGGTENRSGDTDAVGTKTYSLQCSNEVGASAVVTRTVVVNAAPAAPAPTPTTSAPKPTTQTPQPTSSSSTPVAVVTTDTTPPSIPANFQATYGDTVVDLRWDSSTDDRGVRSYELERSTDQVVWQKIGDVITDQTYGDEDVNFQTKYFYRLRAVDSSGNVSGNATVEITTGSFEPNAKDGESLVLTSDDGVAKVTIPSGALTEAASCDLKTSGYLAPTVKNYASVSGPYELLCKLSSGSRLTVFAQPVTVQVNLSDAQKKRYGDLKLYTHSSDWQVVKDVSADNSFVLGDSSDFAILAKTKKTPLWQKVLITIVVIAAVIGVGLIGLTRLYRLRLRRQIEQQNRDSYYKERGY